MVQFKIILIVLQSKIIDYDFIPLSQLITNLIYTKRLSILKDFIKFSFTTCTSDS